MLIDSLRSAVRSLWASKLRSFLTLLGVIIGIYAVVTLLSVARGVQKQTTDLVEGFGPRTLIVLPGEQSETGSINLASQFAPSTLLLDDVDRLRQQATLLEPDIKYVVFFGGILKHGDKKVSGLPVGATPGGLEEMFKATISQGQEISQTDFETKAKVVVINQSIADKLSVKVGDTVMLGTNQLTVSGIFTVQQQLSFGPGSSDMFLIPATLATQINQSNQIHRIIVKARETNQVELAKQQVIDILTAKHGAADFTVLLPTDILKTFNQVTNILAYMVAGIASISLLVGGIGISNIMLVTVAERTREIGIRKAVGATDGMILLQFLIESVILTMLGAIIGIGLASLTGLAVAHYTPLQPALTSQTIGLALAMGLLTGVIFGLFPAYRAARKNPVQALRSE